MRTTLNLDDETMQAAMKLAPDMTKTAIVNHGLRLFVSARNLRGLLKYQGKALWDGDPESLRRED